MQDIPNKSDSESYVKTNKQVDEITALQREFFLGFFEDKTQKRILELIMDNTPEDEMLETLLKEDLPKGD